MLYSVGHSTHSQDDFTTLLQSAKIDILVDVRSHPGSRWPQFQKEQLETWIPEASILYEWLPELGGWSDRHIKYTEEMSKYGIDISAYSKRTFPKQRIAQQTIPTVESYRQEFLPGIKPYWNNKGLWEFQFFMSIAEFFHGANKLIEWSKTSNVAFFCCECQWWRCHRSMIADFLSYKKVETYHIMPHMRQKNKVKYIDGSKLTSHSSVIGNRLERYESVVSEAWKDS